MGREARAARREAGSQPRAANGRQGAGRCREEGVGGGRGRPRLRPPHAPGGTREGEREKKKGKREKGTARRWSSPKGKECGKGMRTKKTVRTERLCKCARHVHRDPLRRSGSRGRRQRWNNAHWDRGEFLNSTQWPDLLKTSGKLSEMRAGLLPAWQPLPVLILWQIISARVSF